MSKDEKYFCESCGQPLNEKTMVWLELNCRNNLYTDWDVAPWPPEDSQGGFTFGANCAKRILKNGGLDTKPVRWRR